MYIIIKNDVLFPDYMQDTIAKLPEKSYLYLTGEEAPEGADISALLKDRFGDLTQDGEAFDVYSIKEITPIVYDCPVCGAITEQAKSFDYFTIYNQKRRFVGHVFRQGLESAFMAADKLKHGHCPICEEWGDGFGTFCSRNGYSNTAGMFSGNLEYYLDLKLDNDDNS